MHAEERFKMMISILDAKIKEEEEFHAYYSTLSAYCEQHGLQEDMEKATEILEKLVQTEQRKNEAMYKDKESKWFEPTSDRMWAGLTSVGPSTRTTQPSRSRFGYRSRSRSPRGRGYQPHDFGRGRGRGVFRGRNPRGNYRGNSRGRGFCGNYRGNALLRGQDLITLTRDHMEVLRSGTLMIMKRRWYLHFASLSESRIPAINGDV